MRLSTFVPLCKLRILSELEGGAATTPSGTHASSNPFGMGRMSDAPFHYYQAILNEVILGSGPALIEYLGDVKEVLDVTFEQTVSRRGFQWASKLLQNTLWALLTVYPLDTRSHSETKWSDPRMSANLFLSFNLH
jgi:hypothetical protein